MAEELYDVQHVARLWKVHPDTILELAQSGELQSVRIGRRRLYRESALRDFLAKGGVLERASDGDNA